MKCKFSKEPIRIHNLLGLWQYYTLRYKYIRYSCVHFITSHEGAFIDFDWTNPSIPIRTIFANQTCTCPSNMRYQMHFIWTLASISFSTYFTCHFQWFLLGQMMVLGTKSVTAKVTTMSQHMIRKGGAGKIAIANGTIVLGKSMFQSVMCQ